MTDTERFEKLERRVTFLEIAVNNSLHDALSAKSLIAKYGESVNKKDAAKILGVTRATVYAMLKDGRITICGDSKRVSVRSIGKYLGVEE